MGVALRSSADTSTPYLRANPTAAGVGSPSGLKPAETGGPVTSSSKSVCRSESLAIRAASALTLLVAVLVLGGALAAGHRHRVYDAVILKTVGATRMKLLAAFALEYLMLGAATAVLGLGAGFAAAALVITKLMKLSFSLQPGPPLLAAMGAVAVTVALGAGLIKEAWDLSGHGDASWRDLTWDVVGTTTGVLLAYAIDWTIARLRGRSTAGAHATGR